MRVSFNWLNEIVETGLSPEEVAEKLTMGGLEVEKIERPGERLDNIVVGQVLSVERHPNADKLTVCRVNSGKGELQIICGAPNVRAGAKVALGLLGATLFDGKEPRKLRKVRIRGVESQGMICSEMEVGLGEDAAEIIILPDELEMGESLASALGLDDTILVIDVTPNRPDCLSIMGVAREVGAILDKKVKPLSSEIVEGEEESTKHAAVAIEDFELCPRYCARVLTGVKVGPSPQWLRQRIELCGIRGINNIVDATNYVMLEMGQPLHAFDLEKLLDRRIIVRRATRGETIVTLDWQERRLGEENLVIADSRRPVAIAGVMGGANTEVDQETTSVLLESAYFKPSSVRRTSTAMGLSTEASYRFERGADPGAQAFAATRAAEVMRRIAGGEVKRGVIEASGGVPARPEVRVRNKRVNLLLGTSLAGREMEGIYSRLGVEIVKREDEAVVVRPPSFRRDLSMEIDFVEEVARIFGYNRIPTPVTRAKVGLARRERWQTFEEVTKNVLTGLGFFEIICSDLLSERQCRRIADLLFESPVEEMKVINPVSAERNTLRPSLLPGLLECVGRNQRQKRESIRLFEVGHVHRGAERGEARERAMVCLAMSGGAEERSWDAPPREADFYDLAGAVETYLCRLGIVGMSLGPFERPLFNPGRSARILAADQEIGYIGELSGAGCEEFDVRPRVIAGEMDAELLTGLMAFSVRFEKLSIFPGASRDIAIVVDERVTYEEVVSAVENNKPEIVEKIELFDVYRGRQTGAGKKSMAFSLKYRSKYATLTDEEVEAAHRAIKEALTKELACEIRERK